MPRTTNNGKPRSKRRLRGTDDGCVDAWRKGLRLLTDQGRLLWLLGQGLDALVAAMAEHATPPNEAWVATAVRNWVQSVIEAPPGLDFNGAQGLVPSSRRGSRGGQDPSLSRTAKSTPAACALDGEDLSDVWCPVVWIGSRDIRGTWATMVLGVGVDGVRRLLAVGGGSVRDTAVADALLMDLTGRGLIAANGMLVVTEGSRILDAAVRRAWGPRALVSHCRRRVLEEVASHVVEAQREAVRRQLTESWSMPPESAAGLLRDVVKQLQREAPGGADRLARSVEASLAVDRLGITGPLKERLTSMGTCGMAFNSALRLGSSTEAGVEALAAGLPLWLARTRRLMGWQDLANLAHALQRATAASVIAPSK